MSRIIIYLGLPSPAASSDLPESRPGKPVALCLVLLRMGFTCAPSVTRRAVVSYTAFPPLPGIPRREALSADGGAVYFYCTGLGVTSTGRYPASCPAKPGLSSPAAARRHKQPRLFILLIIRGTLFHGTWFHVILYLFSSRLTTLKIKQAHLRSRQLILKPAQIPENFIRITDNPLLLTHPAQKLH